MLEALPHDGQRHEIIDGVHYVTPSPGGVHQLIVGELYLALAPYVKANSIGWLVLSPFDIDLGDDTIVEPDLVVVPRLGAGPPVRAAPGVVPILAIEVISPSTTRRDRSVKRLRYQRAGIAEYWIVDPFSRLVERWRPSDDRPEIMMATLTWHPPGATSALSVELSPIFDEGEESSL